MPGAKRNEVAGRGAAGETAAADIGNRAANRVHAQAAASPEGESLQSSAGDHAGEGTAICTDGHGGRRGSAADNGPAPGARSGQARVAKSPSDDLSASLAGRKFGTILADPPWRFANRTGKVAPEHRRLDRYETLSFDEIAALPVADFSDERAHCYLWVPNALLPWGLGVLEAWGFEYKTNLIWHKVRKDGGSDGRGVGFYFRNVTEMILFGVRGKHARTLDPGRSQVNLIASRKREHSRKPDEQYELIEACSWGPYLELFGRGTRANWTVWGYQAEPGYRPDWPTYSYNSASPSP